MPIIIDQGETTSVLSTTVDPAEERVLFAFCERDRAQFFPAYRAGFPGQGQRHFLDTGSFKSPTDWVDYLKDLRPTIIVSCWSTPAVPVSLLNTDYLPLRYLCHTTGSVRPKVNREFIASGGIVTNWGNVISHNVAEHALLLILASLRNLPQWRTALQKNKSLWGDNPQTLDTRSLRERRVGIHGFGNVAIELLRLLAPFDVECLAYSHGVPPRYMKEKGVTPCGDLDELFRKCDVVVECEALTPLSAGSVTEQLLRSMPEGGVFVNVGRGAVVDEKALTRVAAEGRIRVAIDVYEVEPLPIDSPLLDVEGLIASPHIAGPTNDWFHRCGDHALKNVDRYLEGQTLSGVVTLEIYDRTT